MRSRKSKRNDMLASADALGPGDGLDPRFDARGGARRSTRKVLQLCREVQRTLGAVLAGECDDDVLRDLFVQSVVPAPNAARLLVTVSLAPSGRAVGTEDVLRRLHEASARLRGEVAAAVNRRKAPELAFQVVRAV